MNAAKPEGSRLHTTVRAPRRYLPHMRYLIFTLLVAAVAMAFSCKTKRAARDQQSPFRTVRLGQGACFGTCPVYTLAVRGDGEATFEGVRYAEAQGIHTRRLTSAEQTALNAAVGQVLAQAETLPKEIKSNVMDYPTSVVTVITKMDSLVYKGTVEMPGPVQELRTLLSDMASPLASGEGGDPDSWTADPNNPPLPANHLEVVLEAADQIDVVTEGYFKQQLKMVRFLRNDPPTFLLKFDPFTMTAEEMVKSLEREPQVQSARVAPTPGE